MRKKDWNFPIIFLAVTTLLAMHKVQGVGPHGGRIVSDGSHKLEIMQSNQRFDVYGGANETEIPQNMTLKLLGDPKAALVELKALPPTEKEAYHFQGNANLDPKQESQVGIALQFNIGQDKYTVNVPK